MKKCIKVIIISVMVLGIVFSISNFISVVVKADDELGAWEYFPNGVKECMGSGQQCKKSGDSGPIF